MQDTAAAIATTGLSSARRGRASVRPPAVWLILGGVVGAIPVVAVAANVETRYVLYGVIGAVVIGAAPYLAKLAGSAQRLVWVMLVFSLQLEMAYAPVQWSFQKVAGPYGLLITPLLLCAVVLFAMLVARRLILGVTLRVPRGLLVAGFLFLATALLSAGKSPDRKLSGFGLFEIMSLLLTSVVAAVECARAEEVRIMRATLWAGLLVQSVLIMSEQVTGVQFSLAHGVNATYGWGSGEAGRFAGTFGSPSSSATFIVIALLFLLGRMFSGGEGKRSRGLWLLFALGFLALLLTRTRAAWVGFAIGGSGLMLHYYRRGSLSLRLLARLMAGAACAGLLAAPLVMRRLTESQAASAQIRENLIPVAMAMIKSDPVRGVGLNTATNQVYSYARAAGVRGWVFIVHNQFLLIAAETGLPGLAAFIVLFLVGIRSAWMAMRYGRGVAAEMGAVVFWCLIALVWALNLDHVSGCLTYAMVWVLIGMACGLRRLARTPLGPPAPAGQ